MSPGKSLNLGVVAEGIETEEQRDLLTSIGCDEMQGYLLSGPVPANEPVNLLGDGCRSEGIIA